MSHEILRMFVSKGRLMFFFGVAVLFYSCSKKSADNVSNVEKREDTLSLSVDISNKPVTNFILDSLMVFDSERQLREVFGENVKRSKGYLPEGMGEYINTLLYPGTDDQVEFIWQDSVSMAVLGEIRVFGATSSWKTYEGITLGTSLKELERLNKKPFLFYGFGWDYSGTVDWEEGQLFDRRVFVFLDYPGESIPNHHSELIGDHTIRSNSEIAQEVNPIVRGIVLRKN